MCLLRGEARTYCNFKSPALIPNYRFNHKLYSHSEICVNLIGAQGVGRRTLKNRIILSDRARFGTTIPREYHFNDFYGLSRCSSVTAVVLPLGSTGFARYWNFQLSVKNNSGLFCFCITSLGVWSRKLGSLTQPIWYITKKTNRYLVARVFLRFGQVGRFQLWAPFGF